MRVDDWRRSIMTWRRAFFWLWIIVSVLWVAASSVFVWSMVALPPAPVHELAAPTAAKPGSGQALVPLSDVQAPRSLPPPPFSARVTGENVAIWLLVGIAPPALLLLVGSALAWAFTGFRARAS
jgi:hypothetical protein